MLASLRRIERGTERVLLSGRAALDAWEAVAASLRPDLTGWLAPRRQDLRAPPRRIVVLVDGPNPSCDYYLTARLADSSVPWEVIDTRRTEPEGRDWVGVYVILCRYLAGRWRGALRAAAPQLAGLALFLDDDIEALVRDPAQPLKYRWRLARQTLGMARELRGHFTGLWVSTPVLAGRLAAAAPAIVPPIAERSDLAGSAEAQIETPDVAFHATASHAEEHAFAIELVTLLKQRRPAIRVEVIASGPLAARWRQIGVEPRGPMSWPLYRALGSSVSPKLFVVPMARGRTNDARAPTKAIDVVRAGAAALFADVPAYARLAQTAPLLPPDLPAWTDATLALLDDQSRCRELALSLQGEVASWPRSPLPIPAG